MSVWPSVTGFVNQEALDEEGINRRLNQLRTRDDFLRQRLDAAIGAGAMESLRVVDVPLPALESDRPALMQAVRIDPVTGALMLAKASISEDGISLGIADNEAYVIGLCVAVGTDVAAVVIGGCLRLDDDAGLSMAAAIATGEELRGGPYYLSESEAGKLTATPVGIAMYVGFYAADSESSGKFIVNPSYKDVMEAHRHRAFALESSFSGKATAEEYEYALNGLDPLCVLNEYNGTHTGANGTLLTDSMAGLTLANYIGCTVHNLETDETAVITNNDIDDITTSPLLTWTTGDRYKISPRLGLYVVGDYTGGTATTYTLTLTDDTGVVAPGAGAPWNGVLGFEVVYLKWESNDPVEGSGLVRVTGYDVETPFGTKGCVAVVDNLLAGSADPMFNWCEAGSEDYSRRQWTIEVPTAVRGWRKRSFRAAAAANVTNSSTVSLQVSGYPTDASAAYDIVITTPAVNSLTYLQAPSDGETVTFNGVVYEFDDDGVIAADSIAVAIESGDMHQTYHNLVLAAKAEADPDLVLVLQASAYSVRAVKVSTIAIATANLTQMAAGPLPGVREFGTGSEPSFLVYDDITRTAVTGGNTWGPVGFYDRFTLLSGLQLFFAPFDADGSPSTDNVVPAGERWEFVAADPAPGAELEYAMGMDADLAAAWPPVPATTAVITLDGVEEPSRSLFEDGVYESKPQGLFWYGLGVDVVPWRYSPGNMVLYALSMRLAESGVVTSIQSAAGSPIRVWRCGTRTPATTGALEIGADFGFNTVSGSDPSYMVVKSARENTLIRGPVVSKLIVGPGLELIHQAGAPRGCGSLQLMLGAGNQAGSSVTDLLFENAKQELMGMFPYIKLLPFTTGSSANRPSGFVAKFQIPHSLSGRFQILLYATVFGLEDVAEGEDLAYAGLTLEYNVLRDYEPEDDTYGTLEDGLIRPESALAVAIPMGVAGGIAYDDGTRVYKAYDPILIHNDDSEGVDIPGRRIKALGSAFPELPAYRGADLETVDLSAIDARAGSTVAVRIARSGVIGNPEYTAAIGILNLRWKVIAL